MKFISRSASVLSLLLAGTLTVTSVGCAANTVDASASETDSALSAPADVVANVDAQGFVTLKDPQGNAVFSQQAQGMGDAVEGRDAAGRTTVTLGSGEVLTVLDQIDLDGGATRVRVRRGDGSTFTFDSKATGSSSGGVQPKLAHFVIVIAVVIVIVLIVTYFAQRDCLAGLATANAQCVAAGGLPGGSCTQGGFLSFYRWTMDATCGQKSAGGGAVAAEVAR